MGDGGKRIGRAGRRLGRVLAARAVHAVELLGQRVIGLELVVGNRPGGRDPVVMAQLAEILRPQPVQSGSVELGRAAHAVVDLGLELLAVRVAPGIGRDVAVIHEDRLGRDVLRLARKPSSAFQEQDPLARGGEVTGQCAAARAAPDDDHVVVRHRPVPSPRAPSWPAPPSSAAQALRGPVARRG